MVSKIRAFLHKENLKKAGLFFLINLGFFVCLFPVVVLKGPFSNLSNTVIGAVATSRHHSLLEYVMSKEEINSYLANPTTGRISLKLPQFRLSHSDSLKLIEINGARYKGYLLEIADPTRVKVGVAQELGREGQTPSEIARKYKAIAAINAGGFDDPQGQGNGGIPTGVVIKGGKFLAGEKIPGRIQLVGLDWRGTLIVGSYTIKEMKNMGIREGVSFLPALIINGKKQITDDGGWGIAPRTAIGQRKDGTILFLVIDGRQPPYSIGATLTDVQNVLFENGAYTAGNLDGGSSTVLYYDNEIVNHPANLLGVSGERPVPTALIVTK